MNFIDYGSLVSTETTIDKSDVYKDPKAWRKIVVKYQKPCRKKAIGQIANTLLPMLALWVAMAFVYDISYWLTIPLILLTAGLTVRTFIIFHDCGHQSFFKSRKANDIVGYFMGVLTFTPYRFWHWEHGIHHSTAGDLDGRAEGDIWTMTVKEYEASSKGMRFAYRLVRSPLILFTIAPMFLFLVWQRFSSKKAKRKDRLSVVWTNIGIAAMVAIGCYLLGWQKYVILQLSVCAISTTAGVWMFYVQHQFEDVYWARKEEWNFAAAALEGSSFYKLPKILQWFSGNIGFHHIHHLSSRIPNYRLEECHNAEPLFQQVPCLTIRTSLTCTQYRLLDEDNNRLVGFNYLKEYRKNQQEKAA
ncbi:MAG: fatty acid desaturase [Verrucomicrobiae bacterium]|nr:fatty acid desaturase [Verrucomicrobiae bacterium]NNJ42870.1 fatty acid desaturase [Akkermansiaceae bacterium]